MIKVLHLVTSLREGGTQRMLSDLVRNLDRGRFRPVVASLLEGGEVAEEIRSAGIVCHELSLRRGRPGPHGLLALRSILRDEAPDLLSTWLYHADLAGTLATLGRRLRCPMIWNLRCSDIDLRRHPFLTRVTRGFLSRLAMRPAAIVANSHAGKAAHISAGYRPRRWEVIHNGIDTRRYRPDPSARVWLRREIDLPADSRILVHAARVDPEKDFATLVDAFGRISGQRDDLHLLLAGRGIDRDNVALRVHAESVVPAGFVHLLGPREDLPRIFAGADLTVLAARSEGFPSVVAESMACGTPCVTSDVGDAAEIVGPTGRVVARSDPAALASAIAALLDEPQGLVRLGAAARARIRDRFPLARSVERFATLYEEVAGG